MSDIENKNLIIEEITTLYPTKVKSVFTPYSIKELQDFLKKITSFQLEKRKYNRSIMAL